MLRDQNLAPLILLYLWYIIVGPGKKAAASLSWTPYMRRWSLWKYLAAYFPVRIHKTVDLDPSKSYVFGLHPHGVLTISVWATFASDGAGFPSLFPGIDMHPATLNWNFRTPIARELMLLLGFIDASAPTLRHVLKAPGRAVLLAIGGAQEALLAWPGTYDIILNKRKGFVKIALATGASLVPVLSFGENDVVTVVNTCHAGWARSFQRFTKKAAGFVIPLVYGEGLFGLPFGILPHRVPITTVVGRPIEVPKFKGDLKSEEGQALVERYHAMFVAGLKQVWEEHKEACAPQRTRSLRIVQ
ncbi:hypothetical protein WJX81_006091 [Elliptochloris bilobata]|uniref:Acyltransferase n=1 Tax=Elliptochloris bilobata TaxID=381761 RepID=A0AAW1RCY0_9CHLO